jgi:deaminated glutathione amidase
MKLAAIQMVSTPDVERNLASAWNWLERAADEGVHLAALPEYFCLLGRRDTDKLQVAEELGHGPIQDMLARAARTFKLWIVGGTLPLRLPGRSDRVRNSCLVFDPDGGLAARYDKIHLFAFDNGRERYDEAAVLEAGDQAVSLEVQAAGCTLRMGLSVCYDLRFPELYRRLSGPGLGKACDLLCVPAAFTHTTGKAHWELLLRARAVENQCYVLAPAQGGLHENGRRTWGHSMIVDPWGAVLAQRDEGEALVVSEWQVQRIQEVRQQLPALGHRTLG